MSLSSVGEKFELCLISTYLLKLFVAEYIREININFCLSLMFICTLQFQVILSPPPPTPRLLIFGFFLGPSLPFLFGPPPPPTAY